MTSSPKMVLPAMILMDVADRLDGASSELTTMCLPPGGVNPAAGLALTLTKSLWSTKAQQGTETWRDLEQLAGNIHRAMPADAEGYRAAVIDHIATLTGMLMDLDRHRFAQDG